MPMTTFVFQRRDRASRTEQNHRLIQKSPGYGLIGELPSETGNIPTIKRKHRH